jgi:tight adherence protein B
VALLVGLIGGLAGFGVVYLTAAWSPPSPARVTTPTDWRHLLRPIAVGLACGLGALLLTGWLVAALAGAYGGFCAVRTLSKGRASAKVEQARIIALASWCEQLRDLLTAEYGIVGTIAATARTCPEPIRPEVERLATRLSRQDPRNAIRQFAAELDDPSGDLVASVLMLAMSRSSRTSELLSELAGTIRERAAMRLRVEADRSGQRSEARFIITFSAIAITGVLIFGRDSEFLDAYDDGSGQLVLLFVIACFAIGGWWMSRLTRFERPARFLSITEEQ